MAIWADVGKSAETFESRKPQFAKGHQERYCGGANLPTVLLLSTYSTSEISLRLKGATRPPFICSSPYWPVNPPVGRSSDRSIVCTRKVRGSFTQRSQLATPKRPRTCTRSV